jgi:hypothetical protein
MPITAKKQGKPKECRKFFMNRDLYERKAGDAKIRILCCKKSAKFSGNFPKFQIITGSYGKP